MTKKELVEWLNEVGPPAHNHPENDGRIPWRMVNRYGEWLRRKDPIAFQVLYNERQQMSPNLINLF